MKKLLALAATLMLASCQEAPPAQTLPPISFANTPVMRVAVAQINIVEAYQSPMAAPNVEHQFQTSPAQAVKQWASQRLQAVGTTGIMEIIIEDASVKETPLPKTDGVKGFFTDDQSERYNASLRVAMRLYSGQQAMAAATGDVAIISSRTINEKATIAHREKLFHELTQDMMTQFDTEAEARLRQYFSAFLR